MKTRQPSYTTKPARYLVEGDVIHTTAGDVEVIGIGRLRFGESILIVGGFELRVPPAEQVKVWAKNPRGREPLEMAVEVSRNVLILASEGS